MELSLENIKYLRFYNSGLINRFSNPYECAKALIGIQCQYFNSSTISIFNRTENESITSKGITEQIQKGDLIESWGQRATLHIYCKEDWQKISGTFKNQMNWVTKHYTELGIDIEREMSKIEDIIKSESHLSKLDIINRGVNPELICNWGGLLIQLSLDGKLCIANNENKIRYIHRSKSSCSQEPFGNDKSYVKELMLRYFKTYGPATLSDFSHWSKFKRVEIIDDFNDIINDLESIQHNNKKYYISKDLIAQLPENHLQNLKLDGIYLLSKFDPLLISYKDKSIFVETKFKSLVWGKAGQIEATIFKDGSVIATWRYRTSNQYIHFMVYLIKKINSKDKKVIIQKLHEIADFMEKTIKCCEFQYS